MVDNDPMGRWVSVAFATFRRTHSNSELSLSLLLNTATDSCSLSFSERVIGLATDTVGRSATATTVTGMLKAGALAAGKVSLEATRERTNSSSDWGGAVITVFCKRLKISASSAPVRTTSKSFLSMIAVTKEPLGKVNPTVEPMGKPEIIIPFTGLEKAGLRCVIDIVFGPMAFGTSSTSSSDPETANGYSTDLVGDVLGVFDGDGVAGGGKPFVEVGLPVGA